MDGTTQVLTTLILLTALVVTVIMTQFIRRRRDVYPVRALPAWESVPLMIGGAVEAGRRVQLSSGVAGIGGAGTALALASAEALVQIGRRTAASGTPPLMTVGDGTAIPLMMGALRRAWRERDRAVMPRSTSAISARRSLCHWRRSPGGAA